MNAALVWLILALVSGIFEILRPHSASIHISVAEIVGAIAAWVGLPVWAQVVCALATFVIPFFIHRSCDMHRDIRKQRKMKALIGCRGYLMSEINVLSKGRICFNGKIYNCISKHERIAEMSLVEVIDIKDGNLIVRSVMQNTGARFSWEPIVDELDSKRSR